MPRKQSPKKLVLTTVEDLVSNFLYYDRKDDEELPRGSIEELIAQGEITVDEIVDRFRSELEKGI